LVDWEKASY